jgi:hypothetical protein
LAPSTKISPQFTVADWIELRPQLDDPFEKGAWDRAAAVLKDRIENRFLKPVRILAGHPESSGAGFGFAILALDCLLIDTLQAFRLGRTPGHSARPTQEFSNFLKERQAFATEFASRRLRDDFVDCVRNGLLHDGETRKGWIIKKKSAHGKILQKAENGWVLHRNDFHSALEHEFSSYVRALTDPCSDSSLRTNFLLRMDSICGVSTEDERTLYFAYGSNMNARQMDDRVPGATRLGVAQLKGYRVVFNKMSSVDGTGKANLALGDGTSEVWGVLFRVTSAEFESLSQFEVGYFEKEVTVLQGSDARRALTFVAKPDALYQAKPSHSYSECILEGARDLPSEYQDHLRAMCS